MATPIGIKKGTALQTSSDPCPRGCKTNERTGAVHLLSDHSDSERGRQCTKCSCVIQSVHGDPRSF